MQFMKVNNGKKSDSMKKKLKNKSKSEEFIVNESRC